jgi:hypothetical protein
MRDLARLLVASLAAGLMISLLQGVVPRARLMLWSAWVLGNLLLLLDQHMAH